MCCISPFSNCFLDQWVLRGRSSGQCNAQASRPKRLDFWPTRRTTIRQPAIDHDRGYASDSQMPGTFRDFRIPHVEDGHFTGRASGPPYELDGLRAARTARAENFYTPFFRHVLNLLFFKTVTLTQCESLRR
jgi:hypothetical protein